MAYAGTTSTSPNVPSLVTQALAYASSNVTGTVGNHFPKTWLYASTHLSSDIAVVNFFGADTERLGFVTGDILLVTSSTLSAYHRCLNNGSTSSNSTTSLFSTAVVTIGSS